MSDPVSLLVTLPAKRYFPLGQEDGIKKEFSGILPHEEIGKNGRKLEVPSTKTIFVGELNHQICGRGEWLVKSWTEGSLNEESKRHGLGEIVARAILSEILGKTEGIIVPEAYVYEMPDDIHLVTRFVGSIPSVDDDPSLLRVLSPEVKAKIALCIIATGLSEFPPSSILINEGSKTASLIDLESITLPQEGNKVLPSFVVGTQRTLSYLRAIVPKDDPSISEEGLQDKFVTEVESCLLQWKKRITTDSDSKERLIGLICAETGLPRDGGENKISASLIVENLIHIAENIDNLNVPSSYKAFDKQQALNRMRGNANLLSSLIPVLEVEINQNILPNLRNAIADGNNPEVKRLGHTLKGALGIFCAKEVEDLALQLESMGKTGSLENASQILKQLESKLPKLINALKRSLQ